MRPKFWTIFKWTSLAISVGSVLLAVVLIQTNASRQSVKTANSDDKQARVDAPEIVEQKGDHIVWRLQAKEANQQPDGDMHMIAPTLTLFTEKQVAIPIQSKEAWFNPDSRNIRFNGQVEVQYQRWQLHCDTLDYDNKQDMMTVPGTFQVTGETLRAHGKSLKARRDTQQIWVDDGIWISDERTEWPLIKP